MPVSNLYTVRGILPIYIFVPFHLSHSLILYAPSHPPPRTSSVMLSLNKADALDSGLSPFPHS